MTEQEILNQNRLRDFVGGFALCSFMGLLFVFSLHKLNAHITGGYFVFGMGIFFYIITEIAIRTRKGR